MTLHVKSHMPSHVTRHITLHVLHHIILLVVGHIALHVRRHMTLQETRYIILLQLPICGPKKVNSDKPLCYKFFSTIIQYCKHDGVTEVTDMVFILCILHYHIVTK